MDYNGDGKIDGSDPLFMGTLHEGGGGGGHRGGGGGGGCSSYVIAVMLIFAFLLFIKACEG